MKNASIKALLFASLLLFTSCSREDQLFRQLKDARREPVRAEAIATELSKTNRGVELAVADIDIFGGKTRGGSATILTKSELDSVVDPSLKEIVRDSTIAIAKRMEAAIILWYRTKDPVYLETFFVMVQPPGGLEVEWGREVLSTAFVNVDLKEAIKAPSSEPISLSLQDLREKMKDRKNLNIPADDQ